MANDTEFGLAAYFYSRDIGRVWRVAEALEYGIVGINTGIISTEVAPFGGVKESASAAKARSTASRTSSRSNTSAWAASTAKHVPTGGADRDCFASLAMTPTGGHCEGAVRRRSNLAQRLRRRPARGVSVATAEQCIMTKDQVKAVLERVPTWPRTGSRSWQSLRSKSRQNSPAPTTTRHRTNWQRSTKGLPGKPRARRKSRRPSRRSGR